MFLTFPYIDQAVTLKFRLLSSQFTSHEFFSNRKMSGVILDYTARELSTLLRATVWGIEAELI
jgi:hypothetical protein